MLCESCAFAYEAICVIKIMYTCMFGCVMFVVGMDVFLGRSLVWLICWVAVVCPCPCPSPSFALATSPCMSMSAAAAGTGTTGKTKPLVVVTGGARGIGRATCLLLASGGYDVAVNYQCGRDGH